jgi:uncharacterized protein
LEAFVTDPFPCFNAPMPIDKQTLIETISRVLARYPAVQAAYLFGSHARGEATARSDVDVALIGPAAELNRIRLDILGDFVTEGLDHVDLVLLDGAPLTLQFEAVSPNCLAYAREDFDVGSFFSRTIREYFDFEPYLRIQREALKERLLNGQG